MGANQQQERERAQAPPDGFFTLAWEDTEPSPHQGLASSLPGQTDPLLYGSGLQAARQQAPITGCAWPQGSPDLPGRLSRLASWGAFASIWSIQCPASGAAPPPPARARCGWLPARAETEGIGLVRAGAEALRQAQAAAERLQHVLSGPGGGRVGNADRLAAPKSPHRIGHDPVGRPVAATDHVAGAGNAKVGGLVRQPVPPPPCCCFRGHGRRRDRFRGSRRATLCSGTHCRW